MVAPHTLFVVMGVSGSGKTTIGTALAKRLGVEFADADDYHSLANKQKMAAGHPLTDDDREPWLETLNQLLLRWNMAGRGGVLACSALKESYRATLAHDLPADAVRWVLLEIPKQIIAERMAARHHEFMNPALLDSQFATLERPHDADTVTVTNDRAPDQVVDALLQQLDAAAKGEL